MTEATMPVTVEQCDRDAAEIIFLHFRAGRPESAIETIARHRLNTRATPPSPAGLAGELIGEAYERGYTDARNLPVPSDLYRDYRDEMREGCAQVQSDLASRLTALTANASPAGLAEQHAAADALQELEDEITQAISASFDVDWTARDGACLVIELLETKGILTALTANASQGGTDNG